MQQLTAPRPTWIAAGAVHRVPLVQVALRAPTVRAASVRPIGSAARRRARISSRTAPRRTSTAAAVAQVAPRTRPATAVRIAAVACAKAAFAYRLRKPGSRLDPAALTRRLLLTR